jgi:hypothetical protein
MGKLAVINVWIREPGDCTIADVEGYAWARPCCNWNIMYQGELINGHTEIDVPPGCYIMSAAFRPECCGKTERTMVVVKCDESVCVNLIREYAGKPILNLTALLFHAREAKVPEKQLEILAEILEKIAGNFHAGQIAKYTEKEFALLKKVADPAHLKLLNKYRYLLVAK